MAVAWMRDVLVVQDKWSLSALSTQMAQLRMVLPSPGMHICSLNLTACIEQPLMAWKYAFHCCALISQLVALVPCS